MGNLVFEKLSQTLAAGQEERLNIGGDFFRLAAAQWPVSVSLVKDFRVIGTMQNMLAGDYVRDIDFDAVIIKNGATVQDVTAQIAGGGAGSDRVLGEVSIIDGGKQRTKSGSAYSYAGSIGSLAGNNSHVQIKNPVGSGKVVVVESLLISSDLAATVAVGRYDADLSTAGAVIPATANKLLGGGAPSAQFRTQTSALISLTANQMVQMFLPANGNQVLNFREPVVLGPGMGLIAESIVPASNLSMSIEFFEE